VVTVTSGAYSGVLHEGSVAVALIDWPMATELGVSTVKEARPVLSVITSAYVRYVCPWP